jgi:hypothetical protein
MRRHAAETRMAATEGEQMLSTVIVVAIMVAAGWVFWGRQRRRHTQAAALTPQGIPPETLALEAFAYGNTCLAAGRFDDATAAFQRARELDPKRPHVADRLAEVARRQQAVSVTPLVNAS